MSESLANTLWARTVIDELARAGVREVVIAPGSRSTPLVMACAADDRISTRVHLDERSASFFALGVGKASGRPAAVITTSGTAVANVFPAVVEAAQAGVPLLVLTADRPPRLRGADANQAIDQVGIYGSYVRAFFELAEPSVEARALKHLRTVAARAYAAAVGADPGPVHMNFPFDKPLGPVDVSDEVLKDEELAARGRASGDSFAEIAEGRPTLSDEQLDRLVEVFTSGRGVVVVGPSGDEARVGPAALNFAAAAGFPVLADPLSGARYGPSRGAHVVAGYDVFLRDAEVRDRLEPEVIVRVGASPTSAALQRWIFQHDQVPQIVLDGGGRWKDHGATASHYMQADPVDTLERLTKRWSHDLDAGWSAAWRAADGAARQATADSPDPNLHEGHILATALAAVPDGGSLFVSNSMPIRDLDAFGHPGESTVRLFANRGASGIDGVVSSAFGVASQSEGSTICVIGDVAFFHDQNGLLWSRESDAPVVFVVIDNDGGGIFRMLPISEHDPHFTRFFSTPHGIHPSHAAAAHGIEFADITIEELPATIEAAVATGKTSMIRVATDRETSHTRRAAAQETVMRSVREALG